MDWYFYLIIVFTVLMIGFLVFLAVNERRKVKGARTGDAVAEGEVCACNLFVYKGRHSYITFVRVAGIEKPLKVRYTAAQIDRAKKGSPIGERVKVKYNSKNPIYCEIIE